MRLPSLIFSIILLMFSTSTQSQEVFNQKINLDEGWSFAFGNASDPTKDFNYSVETIFAKNGGVSGTAIDPKFNDSLWQKINLPHDWAVSLPFVNDPAFNVMAHGYKPIGGNYPATSIGWYRKNIMIEADKEGQKLSLQFDGVFRNASVWMNGYYLGNNESGYIGINYDISDVVNYGKENTIVVRVDATQYEGWFYEGAGIYRHVYLNVAPPLHILPDGVFAYTTFENRKSTVHVETEVANESDVPKTFSIESYLVDRKGIKIEAKKNQSLTLPPTQNTKIKQEIAIENPILWGLDQPYLYQLVIDIKSDGKVVNQYKQRFGIRNIEIKPNGLYLNDQLVKLQGVNCHQDHGGIGSALPDYLQYYRIQLLKNMGVNAYRTSHHAPTPELLDACDSLGMLVLDETRLLNSSNEYLSQFERLVRRDRSRTCVFMWSIGNEEGWIHTTDIGKRIAQTYLKKLEKLDPTRLSTYAADVANVYQGVNEVVPVRSFNYRQFAVADYHHDHPNQPIIGTEMGSTVTTRGEYALDSIKAYLPDQDITTPWWASTAETWLPLSSQNDFWLGGFIWTGFDYRGEPTPFSWPNINSHFGVMDMCGFPKNIYYYYQSWWTDKDVLHISPHWNHLGEGGKPLDVWVNSNADSVELILNGNSLGTKVMPRFGHLNWVVNYKPGKLEAIAYKKNRSFSTYVETTGVPTEVILTPYKTTLIADGVDVSVINISVVDDKGREVPNANNMINFNIKGDAKIIGVANGDPSSHEADQCAEGDWKRSLFNGKCQVLVQAGKSGGMIQFEASAPNLWPGKTEIIGVPKDNLEKITIDPKYTLSPDQARPMFVDKMLGADISFLPELEDRGIKFSHEGKEEDAITILKNNGFNYIRLRLFDNPKLKDGYSPERGFCDLAHTLAMAKRVKQAGLKLLLDIHYSDYWADPGKQFKPNAWKNLNFESLKSAMYEYTINVMIALKEENALPDMVQIGNEINHGIIWDEGSIYNIDQLAQLLCAGTKAIKDINPKTQMMLHVALGGQNHESVFFIDQMLKRGLHFDVIGESYYPKWHGTLDDLKDNLENLASRYNKDVIVVEYSAKKDEVNKIGFGVKNGLGKGTCIWEPLNTWESIFDRDGKSNSLLSKYPVYKKLYLNLN